MHGSSARAIPAKATDETTTSDANLFTAQRISYDRDAMGIPWNRAAPAYTATFLPRFLPYHHSFVEELAVKEGDRVLSPVCGPGTDALSFARTIGSAGKLRATDPDASWTETVVTRFREASVSGHASFEVAPPTDASGGPFDVIATAFHGLDAVAERHALEAYRDALSTHGKIGRLEWGPSTDDDPFDAFLDALAEYAPSFDVQESVDAIVDRSALAKLFESAGLTMVRHTVIRHTVVFATAEEYLDGLVLSLRYRDAFVRLGETTVQKVRARFFDRVGGPTAALSFQPAATIAIAALPGAEVELPHRPSVRVPRSSPPEVS